MRIASFTPFLLGLVLFMGAASESQAQARWLQNVQVIAPVSDERVTGTLLDSLAYLAQRGAIDVRREPEGEAIGYSALSNQLNRDGLDFISANQVFITYRLEANPRGFVNEIRELYFIYRADGFEDVDLPIFYVDATQPRVQRLLIEGGTRLDVNEAAFEPFNEQISFSRMDDSAVVAIAGRIIRDPAEGRQERQRLLSTIRRLMY